MNDEVNESGRWQGLGHAGCAVPTDQATSLRRLVAARGARRPRVVAVTSGKGGVGKTNAAVNVGISLAQRGSKVTIVDIDLGTANADVLLGVRPRRDLSHVLSGKCELGEICEEGPAGIRLIAGPSGIEAMGRLQEFDRARLMNSIQALDADMVILDCGGGLGRNVMGFAGAADEVLLVTTPEPTALTDAYATVKTLFREGYGSIVRVVINMADSRTEAKAAYERLRKVAEKFLRFTIADAGYILHDTHVELAVRQRVPFLLRYPKCSASICVTVVASRLASDAVRHSRRGGVFRRVAQMLG